MTAPTRGLAGRADIMRALAGRVSEADLEVSLAQGTLALGDLAGDPDGLDAAAAAFDRAAGEIRAVGEETEQVAQGAARAWQGDAGTRAAVHTAGVGRAVAADVAQFATAATTVADLAGRLRAAQREHADLHQHLLDLQHRVTQARAVADVDPGALASHAVAVADSLASGAELLRRVQAEHDAAAERFLPRPAPDEWEQGDGPVPPGRTGVDGYWGGQVLRYNKEDTEDLEGLLTASATAAPLLGLVPGGQVPAVTMTVASGLLRSAIAGAKTAEGVNIYTFGFVPVWVSGR